MSLNDSKEAATLPPPPAVFSPEMEQLFKRFDQLDANVTMIGEAVKILNEVSARTEQSVKALRQELLGAREGSASAIDIATGTKLTLGETIHVTHALASRGYDLATRIAERVGAPDLVEQIEAESHDQDRAAFSSGR